MAYQPGQASAVLTKHYLRMHPEALSEAAETGKGSKGAKGSGS